jgi:hypothetical protein
MVDLKKVSEEVKSNEPETVQYQITQSDEDENEILIWEEVSLSFIPPLHSSLASLSLYFSHTHSVERIADK